jgi:nucleolar protein 4
MAAAELQKRQRLWDRKQEKLLDTNNKVSRTRLAVFNAPEGATTGQIRRIFAVAPQQYARAHKSEALAAEIAAKWVRIREVRKIDGQDGLVFLEFKEHAHALGALRQVNNNPAYFPDRRLIVEFAIENSFAMRDRRRKQGAVTGARAKRFAGREPPARGASDDGEDG